jgi:hypothetical protein
MNKVIPISLLITAIIFLLIAIWINMGREGVSPQEREVPVEIEEREGELAPEERVIEEGVPEEGVIEVPVPVKIEGE